MHFNWLLYGSLMLIATSLHGQMITAPQQKAINNYVDHANQSAEEMESVVKSLIEYYPKLPRLREGKFTYGGRYTCPVQLSTYYFDKALAESKALAPVVAQRLNDKMRNLQASAEKIDKICKELDVYHKLEDYKQDQYAKAESLIESLVPAFAEYRTRQDELVQALIAVTEGHENDSRTKDYAVAVRWMRDAMRIEKQFLDSWSFNLNAPVPSAWDAARLEKSIAETTEHRQRINTSLTIQYPASSQYKAFRENVSAIVEVKRSGWDGYNAEAKKSDDHSNQVYLDLINYYNGTLVSFFNNFLSYARQDGYLGLNTVKYVPAFRIQREAVRTQPVLKEFEDLPVPPLQVRKSSTPIPAAGAQVLNLYVDFINECVRQSGMMQQNIYNLDSRASYFKGLTDYQGKGKLSYTFDNFKMPSSLFQELNLGGKNLSAEVHASLGTQARVLMNILQEMEQLSVWIQNEVDTKRYESDRLTALYDGISRFATLFEILDSKKELLYHDVRAVYDSYPHANPNLNWVASWLALRKLMDDDQGALIQAKMMYKGTGTSKPETTGIDANVRAVLANEFENLKGIERLGRYNGLCPYSPYEDVPETSRRLSEKLKQVPASQTSTSRHPYQDLVYLYNDAVDDFNKFCELSKLNLLKTIRQPEFFQLHPSVPADPEKKVVSPGTTTAVSGTTIATGTSQPDAPSASAKVVHDTVYIERRDTVYLASAEILNRSMEGYAVNNLVLLLDVSGSMNAPGKLPLLKQAVYSILEMMREEDQVAIVTYSGKAKLLLPPTSFREVDKIRAAIENLSSSGKTDGNAGIAMAYKVADKNYIRGGNNRIILATDGEFEIQSQSVDLARTNAKEDIYLSVFNFGKGPGRNLIKLCEASGGELHQHHLRFYRTETHP